jgi:1-phosphofructokinase family hexose kinase
MILSVTLNPCVDHALFVKRLVVGDTNRVTTTETDAGGKGVNLSRVVAELGGRTVATGFLGGGPGAYVRKVLDAQGVLHDFIEIAGDTRLNFSVEDETKSPPTTLNEAGPEIQPREWEDLKEHLSRYAASAWWVALGGSLPPGVPPDAFAELCRIAHQAGSKVLLDADGEPLRLGMEAGPDFIKPNAKEAGRLLGCDVATLDQARYAALELRRRGPGIVVISRGAEGAVLAYEDRVFRGVSPEVKVNSTIGSGDSLLGGMLWAMGECKSPSEALFWGLAAGAATAATDGSEIARRPVVLELLPHAQVEEM